MKYILLHRKLYSLLILILFSTGCLYHNIGKLNISPQESKLVSNKILYNETGGNPDLLICWNKGEEFISLGAGHFIWYQKNKKLPFKESFPELLVFMRKNGKPIPDWLETMIANGYPWKSRQELLDKKYSQELIRLNKFIKDTILLQTMFIFDRLKKALPKMLKIAKPVLRENIRFQFFRLVDTPGGIYALTDYVNFKGEGVLKSESYNGVKWGLLQVLENMQGDSKDINALKEFVIIAKKILRDRVHNAPAGVNEERWLPIWERRLNTYIDSFCLFENISQTN